MNTTPTHDPRHIAILKPRPVAGWFESSWDLQRGLEVVEAWPEPGMCAQREERPTASRTALPRSITAIA